MPLLMPLVLPVFQTHASGSDAWTPASIVLNARIIGAVFMIICAFSAELRGLIRRFRLVQPISFKSAL